MNGRHVTIAIYQNGGRERFRRTIEIRRWIVAHYDRIVDPHFLGEWRHRFPAIVIEGNADHHKTLIFIFPLKIDKPRNLDLAWAAPGGPEIDHDRFAFVVGEADYLAVHILQFKVWSRLAFFRGLQRLGAYRVRWGASQTCQQATQNHSSDLLD